MQSKKQLGIRLAVEAVNFHKSIGFGNSKTNLLVACFIYSFPFHLFQKSFIFTLQDVFVLKKTRKVNYSLNVPKCRFSNASNTETERETFLHFTL